MPGTPRRRVMDRDIHGSFWRAHILHHAAKAPVYGLWLIEELAEHGYRVSPGTLYPLLARMEANGWLASHQDVEGPKTRRVYQITDEGRDVLAEIRREIAELYREIVADK